MSELGVYGGTRHLRLKRTSHESTFSPVHSRFSRVTGRPIRPLENVFFGRRPRPLCCPCCRNRFPSLPGDLARTIPPSPFLFVRKNTISAFEQTRRTRRNSDGDRPPHRLSYFFHVFRTRRNVPSDVRLGRFRYLLRNALQTRPLRKTS